MWDRVPIRAAGEKPCPPVVVVISQDMCRVNGGGARRKESCLTKSSLDERCLCQLAFNVQHLSQHICPPRARPFARSLFSSNPIPGARLVQTRHVYSCPTHPPPVVHSQASIHPHPPRRPDPCRLDVSALIQRLLWLQPRRSRQPRTSRP